MNLFIIGNGFDLAHNLPTSYEDFHSYLEEMYPDAKDVEPSFDISPTLMPDGSEKYDKKKVVAFLIDVISNVETEDKWCNVEASLGRLEFDKYFEDVYNSYDGDNNESALDSRYEAVAQIFHGVTIKIKSFFSDWIKSITTSNVEAKTTWTNLIDVSNDCVINFNYTSILEKIYRVENVCHLHGTQSRKIIIGHGVKREEFEQDNYPGAEYALISMHGDLKKDTSKVIQNNQVLFSSLDAVENIYSYGFSFSEVDLPYIEEICKVLETEKVTWHLSGYDCKKRRSCFIKRIKQCGFKGTFEIFNA